MKKIIITLVGLSLYIVSFGQQEVSFDDINQTMYNEISRFFQDAGSYTKTNSGKVDFGKSLDWGQPVYLHYGNDVNLRNTKSSSKKSIEISLSGFSDLQNKAILAYNQSKKTEKEFKDYQKNIISNYTSKLKNMNIDDKTAFEVQKITELQNKLEGIINNIQFEVDELAPEEEKPKETNPRILLYILSITSLLVGIISLILHFVKPKQREEENEEEVKNNTSQANSSIDINAMRIKLKKELKEEIIEEIIEEVKKELKNIPVSRPQQNTNTPNSSSSTLYAERISNDYLKTQNYKSSNSKYVLNIEGNKGEYHIIGQENLGAGSIIKDWKGWKITNKIDETVSQKNNNSSTKKYTKRLYAQPPGDNFFLRFQKKYKIGSTLFVLDVTEDETEGEFYLYESDSTYQDALTRYDNVLPFACNIPNEFDRSSYSKVMIPENGRGQVKKVGDNWKIIKKAEIKLFN